MVFKFISDVGRVWAGGGMNLMENIANFKDITCRPIQIFREGLLMFQWWDNVVK